MSKKLVVLLVAMAAVVLLIAGISTLQGGHTEETESSAQEFAESEVIVVPTEMPSGITLDIPEGFSETASPYCDKYYEKNDATIIITGEELSDYNLNTARYTENVKKTYEQSADNFQLFSEDSFETSNTTCSLLEFTYSVTLQDRVQQMECLTAVAVKEGRVYIVTCKSHRDTYPSYANQFRQMLSSMDIADKDLSIATAPADPMPVTETAPLTAMTTAVT